MQERVPPQVVGALIAAVLAISAAGPLVRGADAEPVAVALWRTAGVALLLAPSIRTVAPGDAVRIGLAGVALAAHFVAWFASLGSTTVLRSTVLVCLSPAFVGLFEWVFLGVRPPTRFWPGVAIAVAGASLMTTEGGHASWVGDGLALFGATMSAAYYVLGRSVRPRVGTGTWGALVCAAAAVVLGAAAAIQATPLTGLSWTTWLCIAGLILGPQLIGHNGMTWAMRWLPAARVSALTLLEPIGAALIAAVVFGEVPGPVGVVGALVSLVGVSVAVSGASDAA